MLRRMGLRGCAVARSDRHKGRKLAVLSSVLSTPLTEVQLTGTLCAQEYIPTRDNVIFLIDVQQSMFQEAGLKDTEVRGDVRHITRLFAVLTSVSAAQEMGGLLPC